MNILKQSLVASLILTAGSLAFSTHAASGSDLCAYDEAEMLAMDPWDFDQGNDGWRRLDEHEECYEVAADLIRTYYENYEGENPLERTMKWHEGEIRGEIGQSDAAKALFKQAENPDGDAYGWNYYVRSLVAFLEDDYEALMYNREKLAQLPKPDDLPPLRDPDGNEVERPWPPNLHIVDNFVACYGRSFAEAYSGCNDE